MNENSYVIKICLWVNLDNEIDFLKTQMVMLGDHYLFIIKQGNQMVELQKQLQVEFDIHTFSKRYNYVQFYFCRTSSNIPQAKIISFCIHINDMKAIFKIIIKCMSSYL
jgi:hypothetical protein